MRNQSNFILQKKRWQDLNPSVRMYGTSEPPEMQLDNMCEVVSRSTDTKLQMVETDFSEFSSSDKMYPSMMKPDVKRRWDMKQQEWKNQKEKYNRIERMARAQFVHDNPNLKLAHDLAKTSYGKDLLAEAMRSDSNSPATGTGADLHDEFERDGVSSKSDENIKVTPFAVAEMQDPYSTLTTARDGDGRIVEKLLHLGTIYHHVQYDYDEGGRLSRAFNYGNVIESNEYGKFGERLFADTVSFGKCQYVYDKSLKLVQAGEVKYSYDAKGRLILKQDNGQITKYSYMPNGALHKAQLPNGRIIEYHFDSEGMRIAKSINGAVVEKYLWKDFTTLEAVADGAGQNVKVFAYDDEGDPVAMIYNDNMYYFASDQVGSIYMVADGNGNKVEQIIHDSFGNLIVDTDGAIDIPLGFAAGLLDKDTGLVHFGYREYDPEIGRFTTPDPIGFAGGDVDVYGYCWDDPNNFVDRDGLKGKSEDADENNNAQRDKTQTTKEKSKNSQDEFVDVEVFLREKGVGHLAINTGNGTITGKYPKGKKRTLLPVEGDIRVEDESDFDKSMTLTVTKKQAKKMEESIARRKKENSTYWAGPDDCVDHVNDTLNDGGVETPSDFFNPTPTGYFHEFKGKKKKLRTSP